MTELEILKEEVKKLSKRIEELEHQKKVEPEDLQTLYIEKGFDVFYKTVREHGIQMEKEDGNNDSWSIYNSQNKYALLAVALQYFDIDRIAKQVVAINSSSLKNEDLILTCNEDSIDVDDVKDGLYNNVKKVSETFISSVDVSPEDNYHTFQNGRIHLDAICTCYDGKYTNIIKIYWTPEEGTAGADW